MKAKLIFASLFIHGWIVGTDLSGTGIGTG